MLPSHNDLSFLIEISQTGNLSRAAERIGISQPALSQAVKRLEFAFGRPILIRSKSGVKLTKAGQKLILHARNILTEWEKIKTDAAKDEEEIRGRYTMGCHPSVAFYTLKYFAPHILGQHQNLELQFHHDLSRRICEQVISFQLDFGLVVNPAPHPDLVIREITKDQVSLYRGPKVCDLNSAKGGEGVLICDPDLIQSQTLITKLGKKGIKFKRVVTSSSLEVIADLVRSNAGIGILPKKVVENMGEADFKIIPGAPKFSDSICLIYRVDAQKSAAAKKLSEEMQTHLKRYL